MFAPRKCILSLARGVSIIRHKGDLEVSDLVEDKIQFSVCLDAEEMRHLAEARKYLEESIGLPISRNRIIKKLLFDHPLFGKSIAESLQGSEA